MYYIVTYADGAFEMQNCDRLSITDVGNYEAQNYGGKGVWNTERTWLAPDVSGVVEFVSAEKAERELINMGGEFTSAKQGPF